MTHRSPVRLAGPVAVTCLAGALLLGAVPDGRATRDRPPAAHTGGFGEPTCQVCHLDDGAGPGPGQLSLTGVPDVWQPGETYTVRVTLTHAGMTAAGFQLAARFEGDGVQAGALAASAADAERAAITTDSGIDYAHHLYRGTDPATPDSTCWAVQWTAPASGGAVVFHAVANAADGDDSPIGDVIYSARATSAAVR